MLQQHGAVGDVGCLASGLAARGDLDVLKRLAAIANDAAVGARRRAYAFYGRGLAAQESEAAPVQFRVLAAVERSLLAASEAPDEVRIAALHALALVRVDAAPDLPGPVGLLLERAWSEEGAAENRLLDFRAHVPFVVAAVFAPGSGRALAWCERLGAAAQARAGLAVRRSCVLALGRLAGPWNDD